MTPMAWVPVDVATFSVTPGGRFRNEGRFSGEEFRDDYLVPILDRGDDVEVDLDGPLGFTSSFLEEVFGGLIRKYGVEIMKRVRIKATSRPTRAEKANELITRAMHAG